MKHLLGLLLIVNTFFSFAQPDENVKRGTRPGMFWYFNGWRKPASAELRKYDRLIFDIGMSSAIKNGSLLTDIPARPSFGVNLLFDVKTEKMKRISFGWGLGYSFQEVNTTSFLNANANHIYLNPQNTAWNFDNSALQMNRFYIPLEFRFRTKGWKHFKFVLGVNLGFQTSPKKAFYRKENGEHQSLLENLQEFNRWTYGVHFRMGTKSLALYGSYQFSNLFRANQNMNFHPFQLGLSISLF